MLHERSYLSVFIFAEHTLASQIFAVAQHPFPIDTIVTLPTPPGPGPCDGRDTDCHCHDEPDEAQYGFAHVDDRHVSGLPWAGRKTEGLCQFFRGWV